MRVIGVYSAIAGLVLLMVFAERLLNRQEAQTQPNSGSVILANATPRASTNDVRSLLVGQQLYHFYCASCHNSTGSPGAASLPGVLGAQLQTSGITDDALYQVIAQGTPGTSAHAFGGQLTAPQIWQLIASLRVESLAPADAAPISTATPQIVATISPRSTVPDSPEVLPRLVFAREGNIWYSDGNNSPLQQLTAFTGSQYADQPTYSASTERIAFVVSTLPMTMTTRLSTAYLYTVKLDGSDRQLLWQTDQGDLYLPTWTADGTAVYVTYNGVANGAAATSLWQPRIVRVEAASGAQQTIVEAAHSQVLSPDGRHLVYVKVQEKGYATSLMIAQSDGSNARELLSADLFSGFFAPRFSPDSSQVIVATVGGPATDAQGFPVAKNSNLFQPLLGMFAPPIAEAHSGVSLDMWSVNVDGTELRRLTSFYEDLPMGVYSPNGAEVMIMAYNGMYRMLADGSQLRRVSLLGNHGALDWLP